MEKYKFIIFQAQKTIFLYTSVLYNIFQKLTPFDDLCAERLVCLLTSGHVFAYFTFKQII